MESFILRADAKETEKFRVEDNVFASGTMGVVVDQIAVGVSGGV